MALDEPKSSDKKLDFEGIPWLVDEREEQYILAGSGLHVDYFANNYGAGFYVRRGNYSSSCC